MKTSSILKIGLLAVLAGVLSGCRCSGGGSSETKVKEAARSTKENSLFRDVDWSKYVYEVKLGDWSYDHLTFITVDEAASGCKFDEGLEMYDVIAVPHKGKKVLVRVGSISKSFTQENAILITGSRPDTPDKYGENFDWEPFRKYAE